MKDGLENLFAAIGYQSKLVALPKAVAVAPPQERWYKLEVYKDGRMIYCTSHISNLNADPIVHDTVKMVQYALLADEPYAIIL